MDPKNLDQEAFGERIHQFLSPSGPLESSECLFGRDDQLGRIRKALMAPGRQIFIYGERGVGKSSLANAAATEFQSSDKHPIHVSGSSDATFQTIVWSLIKATGAESQSTISVKAEANVKLSNLGGSWQQEKTTPPAPPPLTIDEAAARLDRAFGEYSNRTIAVIDEFEHIPDPNERNRFAELVKALGDRKSKVKLIFTGVAPALDELFDSHGSAHRQFDTILLERLAYQPRIDIVKQAIDAFETTVDDGVLYRIASVSNGFPYYVHLLTEHLLWAWYEDNDSGAIELTHLHRAFETACDAVNADLRRPYEKATRGRDLAAHVLWATADAYDLERTSDAVWRSYNQICEVLSIEPVERTKISDQLRKLRDDSHGSILSVDPARKLHKYTEPMVRGFVRMMAARSDIHLQDQAFDPAPQTIHTPNISNRKRWRDTNNFIPRVQMGSRKK